MLCIIHSTIKSRMLSSGHSFKKRKLKAHSMVPKPEAVQRLTVPTLPRRRLISSRIKIRITPIDGIPAEIKLLIRKEVPGPHSHNIIELWSAIVLHIIQDIVEPSAITRTSWTCEPAESNARGELETVSRRPYLQMIQI